MPHILDCQSACRNEYLDILKKAGERFKKNRWSWVWAEALQQPELEDSLGIGGFGYPVSLSIFLNSLEVFQILDTKCVNLFKLFVFSDFVLYVHFSVRNLLKFKARMSLGTFFLFHVRI